MSADTLEKLFIDLNYQHVKEAIEIKNEIKRMQCDYIKKMSYAK